jgi:DNA-binding transcriptional LysR family regulator
MWSNNMNMRSSLLKTFLAVARSRNITRAAAEVHLAQSSVSDQLQFLETELRTNLFTRSKMGLELTPAGEVLKPYAEEILSLIDEACAAVEATDGQAAGLLTIGALETIASAKMPQWLSAFRGDHPNINVRLKIAGSGGLLQKLESGDIDIAFCFDRGDPDDRFFKRVVSAEPLVLVAPPDEQPASIGEGLNALAAKNFVATEVGCVYRHLFDDAFAKAGVAAPQLVAEVDSIRTIARLVAAGTGLALVPRLAVIDALDHGDLAEISWPGPVRTVSLVAIWRRRRVQPPALKQLLASARVGFAAVRPADARLLRAVSSLS